MRKNVYAVIVAQHARRPEERPRSHVTTRELVNLGTPSEWNLKCHQGVEKVSLYGLFATHPARSVSAHFSFITLSAGCPLSNHATVQSELG